MTPGCSEQGPKLSDASQHFLAAQKALESGDKETALQELDSAITTEPDIWMYVARGRLHAEAGRDELALADVRAGLALDPKQADLLWLEKELKKSPQRRFKGAAAAPPMSVK
jgi:hypothetical protein